MWTKKAVNEFVYGQEMALLATIDLFIFLSSSWSSLARRVDSGMNKANLFQSSLVLCYKIEIEHLEYQNFYYENNTEHLRNIFLRYHLSYHFLKFLEFRLSPSAVIVKKKNKKNPEGYTL